jgi:hypothetical protein
MTPHNYVLDRNGNVKTATLLEFAEFLSSDRRKEFQWITDVGVYHISTVFLGLDHNYSTHGPPILWESMIFADNQEDPLHQQLTRCSGGIEQAESMHIRMVEHVKQQLVEQGKNHDESSRDAGSDVH